MKTIRIGSRESKLAVVQSGMLIDCIEYHHKEIKVELVTMKTTGDKILDRSLDKVGGKGLFVKELDMALMEKRTDLSVHSLKDMPMELPKALPLLAFSKREDPRDAFILPKGEKELNPDLPIGCSSKRRMVQLKKLFPHMEFKGIRGNVLTRLEKLDRREYSGIVLAAAGLRRLGLEDRISRLFSIEESIPAAGQGILAIQGRNGENYDFLKEFHDEAAQAEAICERAFVKCLNGGCSSPIAAFAKAEGKSLHLTGLYCDEDSQEYVTGTVTGDINQAEDIGKTLANKLLREWDNL